LHGEGRAGATHIPRPSRKLLQKHLRGMTEPRRGAVLGRVRRFGVGRTCGHHFFRSSMSRTRDRLRPRSMQKITTFLMFPSGLEDAVKRYVAIFEKYGSKIVSTGKGPDG